MPKHLDSLRRAQEAYDAQEPPDDHDCTEDCPDCEATGMQPDGQTYCIRCNGDGILVLHQWKWLPGEAAEGTRFKKCRKCGAEEEG